MKPIEGKYLGKTSPHPHSYSPETLLAVPRHLNRTLYEIREEDLPFSGVDVWHAYELSFLTGKGLPVAGLLKLIYPAHSPFLVESKSLKLYLNSFNMERFGQTPKAGIKQVLETIQHDLEKVLETRVEVQFFDHLPRQTVFDFSDYPLIEESSGIDNLTFTEYHEAPHLLTASSQKGGTLKAGTHLLRSNCKITHQPDWGSAFIFLEGSVKPTHGSLLQYLVSLRHEDHFHEEVCELIYKRLWDSFSPSALMVACLYTRRGGLDICPVRVSSPNLFPSALTNINTLSDRLLRQ